MVSIVGNVCCRWSFICVRFLQARAIRSIHTTRNSTMRVVGLISGGKDSCFNLMKCIAEGHEVIALANLHPQNSSSGEVDSYMYQTVGHEVIQGLAESMSLPLYRQPLTGTSLSTGKNYQQTEGDEVEDLYDLLKRVKSSCNVEAVSVGAILSDYQRVRVENVCARLGLVSFSYLWCRDQSELLHEMIGCGIHAVLIKVACMGLKDEHLGKSLADLSVHLHALCDKYGVNVCGEGGEYETLVLDSPLHNQRLIIDESEIVQHSVSDIAPVSYLVVKKFHLEEKTGDFRMQSLKARVESLPMKTSESFKQEFMKKVLFTPAVSFVKDPDLKYAGGDWPENFKSFTKTSKDKLFCSFTADDSGDVIKDTEGLMSRLGETLAKHGMDSSHIAYVLLYVKDMGQFATINSQYSKFFGINPPPRICVEAVLPDISLFHAQVFCTHQTKETHHVQGISHWAPSCIGPYSQAARVNTTLYVSGQIPLIPGAMKALPCGFEGQCHLAFDHVMSVAKVMNAEMDTMVAATIYVSRREDMKSALDIGRQLMPGHVVPVCVFVPRLPRDVMVEWHITFDSQKQNLLHVASAGGVSMKEAVQKLSVPDGMYFAFFDATQVNTTEFIQCLLEKFPSSAFIPIPIAQVATSAAALQEKQSLVCVQVPGGL